MKKFLSGKRKIKAIFVKYSFSFIWEKSKIFGKLLESFKMYNRRLIPRKTT